MGPVISVSVSERSEMILGLIPQIKLKAEAVTALLCWYKKMKEHDLGKDCLAAGSGYRAVPSRDVLPGNEVDRYQLSNVQVSLEDSHLVWSRTLINGLSHCMRKC